MSRPQVRFDCEKAPTIGVRTPVRRSGIYNVNCNGYAREVHGPHFFFYAS